MVIIDAIRTRRSCRTYGETPIEPDKVETLTDFLKSNRKGPFGAALRFRLFDVGGMTKGEIRACGTYGVIQGARIFIVGAVTNKAGAMEDFGYGMERNILQAQSLGLGTCWLGGTFKRTGFSNRIGLKDDELLPAVTPVGYAADSQSLVDRLFRFGAGSDRRKPWGELFFDSRSRPLTKEAAGLYETPLECVRLGPSASNRQPWRIVKDENRFHFYLEGTAGNTGRFGGVKLHNVDMGIAMCHFELASRDLGLDGRWLFETPGSPSEGRQYTATWQAL